MEKLLIVDDHRIFTEGIHFLIEHITTLKVAGILHRGEEVLPFLENNEIDLVLLDIDLPDISGVQIAKEIREAYPGVKILALSMLDDFHSIGSMMKAGADGYCIKSDGIGEIMDTIGKISRGEKCVPATYINLLNKSLEKPEELLLTSRETDVVRLIGEGLTTRQIAEHLFISSRTVETHRKNIYKKLGVHNNIELIQYARRKKWL